MEFYVKVSIFLVIIIIAIFSYLCVQQKHDNFEQHLKVGDIVDYYQNETRTKYTIEKYGEVFCEIRNEMSGMIIKVPTASLMPNLWYKYKPKSYIE